MRTEIIAGKKWAVDGNGNRASVERWGSEENAIKKLESCTGCSGCSDCFGKEENHGGFNAPTLDSIHRNVYEACKVDGALDMSDWHKCDTTHCRAGWVVHLSGKAGYELEKKTSTLFAAMQIYKASGYEISPCRFFDSDDEALEDMKALAETESRG